MIRPRTLAALLLVSAAAPAAFAQEHVLFEVQGRDQVLGTIRPAGEREAIVCNLVQGTTLKAAVKSAEKTGPVPTLEVLKDGVPVDGVRVVAKGRGAALVPFVVPATGTYSVVIAGDGGLDGDYRFKVSWTPQRKFPGAGTTGDEVTFPFAAPANSTVKIALAPARGSTFVPHLVSLDGPLATVIPLAGGGTAGPVLLPVRGDWAVRFQDDGAAGPYTISVAVAARRPAKREADIRDAALAGAFSGGPVVVGAVIDAETGGIVAVDAPGTPLDGASVSIPAGSLGQTTSIFVAQSRPYTPPGGSHPAGPAVEFGPSGTQFSTDSPATVTIPFDVDAFPGGTAGLVVYVKDSNGVVQAVPGPYVFGPDTVSFTTDHFSTFLAAMTGDRGYPAGNFAAFEVSGGPATDLRGAAGVFAGYAYLSDGVLFLNGERTSILFDPGSPGESGPRAVTYRSPEFPGYGVSQLDDSTFELQDFNESPAGRLRRGERDDVLVLEHEPGFQLGATVLLRLTAAAPTLNTIAGRWHAFVWEFRAGETNAAETAVPLSAIADAGTATIGSDGSVAFQFRGGVKRVTEYPGGDWSREALPTSRPAAAIVALGEGQLGMDFGSGSPGLLASVLDGEMLLVPLADVDRDASGSTAQAGLLMLVRQSAGAAVADVVGRWTDTAGGLDLHDPDDGPPPDALGLAWRAERASEDFSPEGTVSGTGLLCLSGYDAAGSRPVQSAVQVSPDVSPRFTLARTGAFAVPAEGIDGAALPSGGLRVYVQRGGSTIAAGFAIRLPPPSTKR